jgi:hypothetical protein
MDLTQALARLVHPSGRASVCTRTVEGTRMELTWIGRKRSLELSPRARLVAEAESDALRRKRESLDWRPSNGFLLDDAHPHQAEAIEDTDEAA